MVPSLPLHDHRPRTTFSLPLARRDRAEESMSVAKVAIRSTLRSLQQPNHSTLRCHYSSISRQVTTQTILKHESATVQKRWIEQQLASHSRYDLPGARRKFTASASFQHGHLTAPKPGEEYVFNVCCQEPLN